MQARPISRGSPASTTMPISTMSSFSSPATPGPRALGLVTPTDTEPRPLFSLSSVLGRAPPLALIPPRTQPADFKRRTNAASAAYPPSVRGGDSCDPLRDDVEAGTRGAEEDPARRLADLMTEPRSTDKWEQRRRRAIVFTIVSVLLALVVAGILVVAFDRGFIW